MPQRGPAVSVPHFGWGLYTVVPSPFQSWPSAGTAVPSPFQSWPPARPCSPSPAFCAEDWRQCPVPRGTGCRLADDRVAQRSLN